MMEFKDKLKALRKERSLSQQELADAIFISRSTVAKWENGLGLPGEESMSALLQYFGVPRSYFDTEEPEIIIVEKNQKINRLSLSFAITGITFLAITATVCILLFMGYRFTSLSAAGDYCSDWPCIRTPEYDFYLNDSEYPRGAREVRKFGILYKTVEGTTQYMSTASGDRIGILKRFEGKECSYYFIWTIGIAAEMGTTEDGKTYAMVNYPYASDHIILNGTDTPLEYQCYFRTDEPIETLEINNETIILTEPE